MPSWLVLLFIRSVILNISRRLPRYSPLSPESDVFASGHRGFHLCHGHAGGCRLRCDLPRRMRRWTQQTRYSRRSEAQDGLRRQRFRDRSLVVFHTGTVSDWYCFRLVLEPSSRRARRVSSVGQPQGVLITSPTGGPHHESLQVDEVDLSSSAVNIRLSSRLWSVGTVRCISSWR